MRALAMMFLVITTLTAQDRRVVPGQFLDDKGKPVANATVTAVWTSVAGPEFVPRDVVTTTTNASGRFRLKLWPTMAYSVRGVGPARDDGMRIATRSARGFVGGVVELAGRPIPAEARVRYQGLDAWPELRPFTVRGHMRRHGVGTFERPLDDSATITLPPVPRGSVILELIDANGRVWSSTSEWLRNANHTVTVPPPLAVDAVVHDENDKPVADARILRRDRPENTTTPDALLTRPTVHAWRQVGTSDASGKVHMRLPLVHHPLQPSRTSLLAAVHADFAGAHAGQTMQNLRIDAVDAAAPNVLQFSLTAPGKSTVRVHTDGQPLAGVRCAVAGLWGVRHKRRYQDFQRQFYGSTDASGSCSFAAIPAGAASRRLLLAIPNKDAAPTLLPTIDLVEDGPTDVDLAQLTTSNIVARSARGTPAQGATVIALPLDSKPPGEWLEPVHCDRGGRATIRAFGRTLAFVFTDAEYGFLELPADATANTVDLPLTDMPHMQFRVVDTLGKPVEGAMMAMNTGTSSSSADTPEQKHIRRLASQLNHRLRDRHRADKDGRILLPFVPPPPGNNTLQAWSNNVGTSTSVDLEATTEEVELVLRKR
ncbi:MAG: hypothetical protein AB8H80_14735 [Planctomycetota bacterium]